MKVAPSMLSADFANLRADIEMVNNSEADFFHLDVMDGVFVPNISFGFPVMQAIAKYAKKPLDVHLMIVNPQNYISQVRDLGAEYMNVHQEACVHLHRTIQAIKAAGMKAAVTLNPATSVVTIEDVIDDVDMILLMSVNPGFGGQKFIPRTLDKLRKLREMIALSSNKPLIEIDGGVNATTAPLLAEAGADVLVAGSYVFGAENPIETISQLKNL
ncbi:MAG: ribulose-phosphate 3-epimerase [Muribaculaceae bacterium]